MIFHLNIYLSQLPELSSLGETGLISSLSPHGRFHWSSILRKRALIIKPLSNNNIAGAFLFLVPRQWLHRTSKSQITILIHKMFRGSQCTKRLLYYQANCFFIRKSKSPYLSQTQLSKSKREDNTSALTCCHNIYFKNIYTKNYFFTFSSRSFTFVTGESLLQEVSYPSRAIKILVIDKIEIT